MGEGQAAVVAASSAHSANGLSWVLVAPWRSWGSEVREGNWRSSPEDELERVEEVEGEADAGPTSDFRDCWAAVVAVVCWGLPLLDEES